MTGRERCPHCQGLLIQFVFGMRIPDHDDPVGELLVVDQGCTIDPQVAGQFFRAWCGTCETMLDHDDEPISWNLEWGEPADFIPPVWDFARLVDEDFDIDDPVDDVLFIAEVGALRMDRVLELYATQRAAGRASRGLADVDPSPLWTRVRELLDVLSPDEIDRLDGEHGDYADILAELARSGGGEEPEDWNRVLEAYDEGRTSYGSADNRFDAAAALHSNGELERAYELAEQAFRGIERELASATAGLAARIARDLGLWREVVSWRLRELMEESIEPDLWRVRDHTVYQLAGDLERLSPSELAQVRPEISTLLSDLDPERISDGARTVLLRLSQG